jgi:hypothetical protein
MRMMMMGPEEDWSFRMLRKVAPSSKYTNFVIKSEVISVVVPHI